MEKGFTKRIVLVGSRTSLLAMTQTHMIIDLLKNKNPGIEFRLITRDTMGDMLLNTKLYKIGDTALFTKELELALLEKEVDFVVHSLKDMPTIISKQFIIGSISLRESCDDAVVLRLNSGYKCLEDLPEGSVIGTSSVRRISQLKRKYPHLKFSSIRGNLSSRLLKLDDPEKAFQMNKGDNQKYEAIILAKAGLERLTWNHRISEVLSYEDTLYAVGQGALACECRRDDIEMRKILSTINDENSMLTCIAERAFIHELEGGCSTPLGVRSILKGNKLILNGCLLNMDGSNSVLVKHEIDLPEYDEKSVEPLTNGHDKVLMVNGDDSDTISTGIEIYGLNPVENSRIKASIKLGLQLATTILLNGGDKILNEINLNRLKSSSN